MQDWNTPVWEDFQLDLIKGQFVSTAKVNDQQMSSLTMLSRTVPSQMFMAHFIWFPKLKAQVWSHGGLAKL
jgi:hypothetical protein